MTANISARELRILIGSDNQDWSRHWVSFEANYTSLGDESERGLIKVEANLELVGGPELTSARRNPTRWRPGQSVYVQCVNDARTGFIDTWFSRLIVLEDPSEPSRQNGLINLSLGCLLKRNDTFEFDNDQSGVQFGVAENSDVVAARLLEASQIPAASISLGSWDYQIAYPFGKAVNSFTEQAGELAWANNARFLYQNPSGSISDRQLSFTATTAASTVDLGVNDVIWEPMQGVLPAEVIKVAGVGYEINTLNNPATETNEVTANISDYVPGAVGTGVVQRTVSTSSRTTGDAVTQSEKVERVQVFELPATIFQNPDGVVPQTSVLEFTDTTETRTYEATANPIGRAKLTSLVTTKLQRGKSLLNSELLPNMRLVERTTSVPTYNGEDITEWIVTNEKAEILSDENSNNPWNLRVASVSTDRLTALGGGVYQLQEIRQTATIESNSNVDPTEQNIWALRTQTKNYSPATNINPPATEYYDGGTDALERHYESEVNYTHPGGATGRNRNRLFTLEFGFSVAQMALMAGIYLRLLDGRYRSDEIELAINDALLQTPPLPEVHVAYDGDTYKYLADALSVEFSPSRAVAHCAGIWLEGGPI